MSLKRPLFKLQETGRDFLQKAKFAMLGDTPGTGKSFQALAAAENCKKLLIVCPSFLKETWKDEALLSLYIDPQEICTIKGHKLNSIQMAQQKDARISIVSYDVAPSHEFLFKDANTVIADECFKEGTLVDTPRGPVPIQNIREGDSILNCMGEDTVVRTHISRYKRHFQLKVNGKIIEVTGNHPILTSRGWVKVENLKKGDLCVRSNKTMQILWEGIQKERVPEYSEILSFLLKTLQSEILVPIPCFKRLPIEPKLYEGSRSNKKTEENFTRYGAQTSSKGWEWIPSHETRDYVDGENPPINMEYPCKDKRKGWERISHLLQNRFRCGILKIWGGSRWKFSQSISQESSRSEEGYFSNFFRVENIQSIQSGSFGESRGSSFYNLEIYKHPSYSVEGILVHNCHYLKNTKAERTSAFHTYIYDNDNIENLYLLSGTAIKNRVSEFYSPITLCSYLTDPCNGKKLQMNFWEFQHHFMNEDILRLGDKVIKQYSGIRNIEELKSYLKGKYLRRKLEDFVEILPLTRVNVKMESHSKYDAELGKAWDCFNEGIKIDQEHFSTIKANAALAKTQFTYEYCRHLMQTGEGPLVIFSYHPAALADLKNRFEGDNCKVGLIDGNVSVDRRHEIKNAFQGGHLDVVLMSIGAGSVGFTLHAARHVIFNDLSWVPGDNDQAEKRIHRIGQDKKCISHRILGGPVDVRIVKALTEKMEVIKEIL